MYIGLHVKYPLFLYEIKLEFYLQNFEKNYSNTNFQENLPSQSRDVPRGRTDTDGQTCQSNTRFSQFAKRAKQRHILSTMSEKSCCKMYMWN
jgi:hypothetical protein